MFLNPLLYYILFEDKKKEKKEKTCRSKVREERNRADARESHACPQAGHRKEETRIQQVPQIGLSSISNPPLSPLSPLSRHPRSSSLGLPTFSHPASSLQLSLRDPKIASLRSAAWILLHWGEVGGGGGGCWFSDLGVTRKG